ncbi:MAG: FlgT C-terminal domain-containing protein, partial [Desulfosarcinaceae bacterium]
LQLGRVLAAKLIGTGSLFYLPSTTMLNLRLIDAETTAVPKSFTKNIGRQADLDRTLFELNRELLATIIQKYPLRGFVVQGDKDTVMLNLGKDQGVVTGSRFSVVETSEPIVYKGRTLNKAPKIIAELEVVEVEPDLCHARIVNKQRSLKADDKVQEILQDGSKK